MTEPADNIDRKVLYFRQPEELPPPGDDEHGGDGDGGPPAIEEPPGWLPPDCPVQALGCEDGKPKTFHYLDTQKRHFSLAPKDHSRNNIAALFVRRQEFLLQHWPRLKKIGEQVVNGETRDKYITVGWAPERVADALMNASALSWSPFGRMRGAGAWRGPDGELILHCGDNLMIRAPDREIPDEWVEPGSRGRMLYAASDAAPQPDAEPDKGNAGQDVLDILRKWNWSRGEIDARLILGWIGAAMLGGALDWRPVAWISGGGHTGKSTLQTMMKGLFGEGGLLQAADATPAGIWQVLKFASLPVAIDEGESEADNRKINGLVKLARLAASGSSLFRGGGDHQGTQFAAWCCFLFSSILLPPLLGQDRSRMAICELRPLDKISPPKGLTERRLGELGGKLRRRLADNWWRWEETLAAYRTQLAEVGHVGRGCDVFGTLLAAADLLLSDLPVESDSVIDLCQQLRADALAELEGEQSNEMNCLQHLVTSEGDPLYAGTRRMMIGEWIERARGFGDAGVLDDQDKVRAANIVIKSYGLAVIEHMGKQRLFVALTHPRLSKVFDGTMWSGIAGARGVWVQALMRLPGAEMPRDLQVRIGKPMRGILVPLELLRFVRDDEVKVE